MNTFKLKIIASNKVLYDDDAVSINLPSLDFGSETFLANHENTILPINNGEMKLIDKNEKEIDAFVGSGFFEFLDNEAMLVCISVELPEEIDARRAQEAKERAEEELLEQRSYLEYTHSQANLARAMERLRIKNRHQI